MTREELQAYATRFRQEVSEPIIIKTCRPILVPSAPDTSNRTERNGDVCGDWWKCRVKEKTIIPYNIF